jgi:uncharacterized membrane protein YobD (UPF0266 family)
MNIYNSGLDTIGKVVMIALASHIVLAFSAPFDIALCIMLVVLVSYSIYVRFKINQSKSEILFFERQNDFILSRGPLVLIVSLVVSRIMKPEQFSSSNTNLIFILTLVLLVIYAFVITPKGIIRKTKDQIFISGIKRTLLLSDIKSIDVEKTKITFHLHSHDVKLEGCNLQEEEIIQLRNFLVLTNE